MKTEQLQVTCFLCKGNKAGSEIRGAEKCSNCKGTGKESLGYLQKLLPPRTAIKDPHPHIEMGAALTALRKPQYDPKKVVFISFFHLSNSIKGVEKKGDIVECENGASAIITAVMLLKKERVQEVKFHDGVVVTLLDSCPKCKGKPKEQPNGICSTCNGKGIGRAFKRIWYKDEEKGYRAALKAVAEGISGKTEKCGRCRGLCNIMEKGWPVSCPECFNEKQGKGTGVKTGEKVIVYGFRISDRLSREKVMEEERALPMDGVKRRGAVTAVQNYNKNTRWQGLKHGKRAGRFSISSG